MMQEENGRIVETAEEVRPARPGRPVLAVRLVSLALVTAICVVIFYGLAQTG